MSNESSGKRVLINSMLYTLSGLLLKCFSFFLLPLYTAYLTKEEYGISSIATSFISTMGFVVAFSLFSAVMRFYVDLKDEPEKLKRFYGTIITFVSCSSVFFGIVLAIFREPLSKYVFSGIDYYPIIFISIISLLFHCLHTVFDNILKSQQKAFKSSVFSILFFLVTVGLNILFVVVFKLGAVSLILSSLISCILYSIYFIIEMLAKKTIVICLDWKLLKSALKYSIPIMPHNLSTSIAVLITKVLIGGSASLASLGVYSVAAQFGSVADTIQSYVDKAYSPWLFEKLNAKEANYKSSIRGISRLLAAAIGLFFIGISLFAQEYIVLFVNKDYIEAWKYVPLIVMVFGIKTIYYFYIGVLFYYKKASRLLFTATLSSSFVNIFLSYFIIPILGVYGSILADAIAMIIRITIIVIISKRFEDIGLRVFDFVLNFMTVVSFIFIGLALSYIKYPYTFSMINLLYKVFIIFAYIGVVAVINKKHIGPFIKLIKNKFYNKRKVK